MLTIITPIKELYDESNNVFIYKQAITYHFEHCLYAIAEWEKKYKKPLLNPIEKPTEEELLDYYRIMCIEDLDVDLLSVNNIKEIVDYMNESQSATTVKTQSITGPKKPTTSEVIYALMVEAGIPFECDRWHINRLLMLITVIGERRNPKKMSKSEIYRQNNEINKARREATGSRG